MVFSVKSTATNALRVLGTETQHQNDEMKLQREFYVTFCHAVYYTFYRKRKQGYMVIVSSDRVTLTYCPVAKSGWSTWRRLFFRYADKEYLLGDRK